MTRKRNDAKPASSMKTALENRSGLILNVEDYGATRNGTNGDTAAIVACYAAARAASLCQATPHAAQQYTGRDYSIGRCTSAEPTRR